MPGLTTAQKEAGMAKYPGYQESDEIAIRLLDAIIDNAQAIKDELLRQQRETLFNLATAGGADLAKKLAAVNAAVVKALEGLEDG